MVEKKDIVIDDEEFRKNNQKKLFDSIENIGNLAKEGSKTTKAVYIYIFTILAIVIFSIGGTIIYNSSNADNFNEFLAGVFGDTELYEYNLVCIDDYGKNITVGNLEKAKFFIDSIGGNCILN